MLFSSDDDDLPDVPTVEVGTPVTATLTSSNQAHRFHELEELHRGLQSGSAATRHKEARHLTSGASTTADVTSSTTAAAASALHSPPAATPAPSANQWSESEEAAFYELRSLVPHLSPTFTCAYGDAILLLAAIRRGGASASDQQSLADRCQSLESDRRQLEQRLERSREECEALQGEVAAAKQKLKAVQEESKGSVTVLAQRREEMRKQLLLEETRSEKLKVRNRKLEIENDALRERMRGQLR